MAKFSRQPTHGKLSNRVRGTVEGIQKRHDFFVFEPKHIAGEVSDTLLEKLKLPPATLKKAKENEAHSIRLLGAISAVGNNKPISAKTAKIILSRALQDLPEFIRYVESTEGQGKARHYLEIQQNVRTAQELLAKKPDSSNVRIQENSLMIASDIQTYNLVKIIGERKAAIYAKAMGKAIAAVFSRNSG